MGKDFNNAAFEEMKKARYYFEYLRTTEKMYRYEVDKQGRIVESNSYDNKVVTREEAKLIKEEQQKKELEAQKQKEDERKKSAEYI